MQKRKQSLKTMISLVGNAAAHRALYPKSAFAIREAVLYEVGAEELAGARRWNNQEIEIFRDKSKRHATSVIKSREYDYKGRTLQKLVAVADKEIERFVQKEMRK